MMRPLLLLSFAFSALSLFCSCGKQAPDPPRVRAGLVLDIFDSVRRGDHKDALAKIRRYKDLDKTNVFISEFENIELANIRLSEAANALRHQDQAAAEKAIREAIRVVGPIPELTKAAADLQSLAELEMLAYRIEQPENSVELARNLQQFQEKAKAFPESQAFRDFTEKRKDLVRLLKQREDRITLYDLEADEFQIRKTDQIRANVLESQRKVEQTR